MNIAVLGANGAIGRALVTELSKRFEHATIHAFARQSPKFNLANVVCAALDYRNEEAVAAAASNISADAPLSMVLVTTGMLHDESVMPEKSLSDLSVEKFTQLFDVNTIVPALLAKHFIPKLDRREKAYFAALSARVGSISDNRLGGWYAYRASKAALNMVIKCAAIETKRRNKTAVVVGLHPGTVASQLSEPFQDNVPEGKLFTPEYSAQRLLDVLIGLDAEASGACFAWDGAKIEP